MSSHFSRSLRIIDTDRFKPTTVVFVLLVVLLAAWSSWFLAGRVSVYASSSSARLEVDRENHPVDAVVGGRVVAVRAVVGQTVKAGDVLLELDAEPSRLARSQEQAIIAPTLSQLALLEEQLAAEQRALAGERLTAQAAIAEAGADARRADAAARFASDEAARLADLFSRKLLSELEALRAQNVATERRNAADAASFAARRLTRDFETRNQDRLAEIAKLKREIAAIEGSRAQAEAATDRLGYDIEQRVVRAAVSGTIADLKPLTVGSVITAGTRICTIVPDGALRVVALFKPAVALGRVRAGQPARVRLEGFPWTQYGSPEARVSTVAGEPTESGTIRVELSLSRNTTRETMIPLQHGLPAEVDVEIERASPAALVLRTIGAQTRVSAAER